jgi:hypothetical protein
MTRTGEIDRAQLRRHWPHPFALSADKVCGLKNSNATYGFAATYRRCLVRSGHGRRRERVVALRGGCCWAGLLGAAARAAGRGDPKAAS